MSTELNDYHCEFVWKDEAAGIAVCIHGDFEGRLSTLVAKRRCRAKTGEKPPERPEATTTLVGPGFFQRAANFAKAALSQVPLVVDAALSGDDMVAFRTREEIQQIADICKACPLFNGEICTHKDCGCNIDAKRHIWLSKIAWKSQRCPDDPPRW